MDHSAEQPTRSASTAVWAATGDVLAHPRADRGLLDASERRKAARFRFTRDRDDFVAAHLLVRFAAARLTGRPVAAVRLGHTCPTCGATDHGRPHLDDPGCHVSLSHTRGFVAAAAGRAPVAVDLEVWAGQPREPVLTSVLTARESELVRSAAQPGIAFTNAWVRKEVLVKIGRATLDDLATTDVTIEHPVLFDGTPSVRTGTLRGLGLVEWCTAVGDAVVVGAAIGQAEAPRLAEWTQLVECAHDERAGAPPAGQR